jgi:hypothetical protein
MQPTIRHQRLAVAYNWSLLLRVWSVQIITLANSLQSLRVQTLTLY